MAKAPKTTATAPASNDKRTLAGAWAKLDTLENIMRGQFPNDFPPDDRAVDGANVKPPAS